MVQLIAMRSTGKSFQSDETSAAGAAESLLAVDLGLRTGLALYGRDGRLRWYRSHNLGSPERLKRAVHRLLRDNSQIAVLVIEGGGDLADIWRREAFHRGIAYKPIAAETWREMLLYERERVNGMKARQSAGSLARKVIDWSGARRPTSLRHDAAEAILIGLWAVVHLGWQDCLPDQIRR